MPDYSSNPETSMQALEKRLHSLEIELKQWRMKMNTIYWLTYKIAEKQGIKLGGKI